MFNWFKKKSIPVVIVETESDETLSAPNPTIKVSNGAPQVKDYPRSVYNAYWETYHNVVNGRHTAKVRFCSFNGKTLSESDLTSGSKEALFEKVNALIVSKMASFKKG